MSNFAYLKTDLINTTENDSTEFSAQVSAFVKKTEFRLVKDLDDQGMTEYASVSVSSGNAGAVPLNDRVRIVRNVNYIVSTGTTITNLLQRTSEYVNDYWPVSASTGTPRYYARKNNTQIYIVPTPASTVTGEIQTVARPTSLTSAAPSNYYSEFCYNALFYRCMFEANFFMKNWDVAQTWEAQYKNSIDGLRNQARRTRQDDMETPRNPVGGPDTIIQGSQ